METHISVLNYISALEEQSKPSETVIHNVKDKLPAVECGSFLVYAPKSFPKNSRWMVAEYYEDVKGFYSESSENFLEDATHWMTLPNPPQNA